MKPGMPPELSAMFERFNQLGRLLPQSKAEQGRAVRDEQERASLRLIIAEMTDMRRQIVDYLDQHGARRVDSDRRGILGRERAQRPALRDGEGFQTAVDWNQLAKLGTCVSRCVSSDDMVGSLLDANAVRDRDGT